MMIFYKDYEYFTSETDGFRQSNEANVVGSVISSPFRVLDEISGRVFNSVRFRWGYNIVRAEIHIDFGSPESEFFFELQF